MIGIRLQTNPTNKQKLILSQWMGCARNIWNAKVAEEKYYRTFARKYYPIGTYSPIDTKYSQFKDKELTPWLAECPSQILRNSATNWYETYHNFMKGLCGRPKRKPKTDKGSIYLTRELFEFKQCDDGNMRLFIGTKTNNIGYLSIKKHKAFGIPKSLYIRKEAGKYFVSFCYEQASNDENLSDKDHLAYLSGASDAWLEENVTAIDRGVTIPVHAGHSTYDFTDNQKRSQSKQQRYIKRLQRKLARQQKQSNQRKVTKHKLSKAHKKITNVREDFCHKTSRTLVDESKVIIFENLKIKNMTRKPKAKKDKNGKWIKNGARAKAGLNKAVLNVGWYKLELFTRYKATSANNAVFKVAPHYSSQECAECGHAQPGNRKNQAEFICRVCNHIDNADNNATRVLKKRAIKLFKNSGTELAGKGIPLLSTGRGANRKSGKGKSLPAARDEASKKKGRRLRHVA